eukprot:gene21347-22191_t
MIKLHYGELFDEGSDWRRRAETLSKKTFELVSFLADVLGVTTTGAAFAGKVTYHDSCSGLRELGIREQPRRLLGAVAGLQIAEMSDSDVCCGFGGMFCVKYPDISNVIVEKKTANIAASGAGTLLAGDMGCLMNMAGKLQRQGSTIEVRHVAEVLAGMAEGPAIGQGKGLTVAPTTEDRMARAKEKPRYEFPADYEDDYGVWLTQQADLLRLGRFNELDLANLVEEIEDMGSSVRRALESSYRVLLLHLLKWEFQPERRTRSWYSSIVRERGNIESQESNNKTLHNDAVNLLPAAYRLARKQAAAETGMKKSMFPEDCPYLIEQIRQDDWLPGVISPDPDSLGLVRSPLKTSSPEATVKRSAADGIENAFCVANAVK